MTDTWDSCLNAWILNWNCHQFDTGFPLGLSGYFNGNIMYPHKQTLAFSEHLLGVALVAWPMKSLFAIQNPLLIFNLMHLLTYALTGFAVFLLGRRLGLQLATAWMAGVLVAFSPFRMIQHGHFQLLSFYWLPVTLWTLLGWLQTGRKRWLAGAASAHLLQLLSSYYLAIFHCLTVTLFLLASLARPPAPPARHRIAMVLAVLSIASLPLIPISLPYFQLDDSLHLAASEAFVRDLSATPSDYLRPEPYGPVYRAITRYLSAPSATIETASTEHQVFPGMIVMGILIISLLLTLFRRTKARTSDRTQTTTIIIPFTVALGAIAFILSLGPDTESGVSLPFKWLSAWLPGFKVIRVPARFSVLVQFSLALLAAAQWHRSVSSRKIRQIGAVCIAGLFFLETGIWPAPARPFPAGAAPPEPYAQLARDPDGGPVAEFPLTHRKYQEMLKSCYHWRPLVNGISGYQPPGRAQQEHYLNVFPHGRSLDLLYTLGVRDLIVHNEMPEWDCSLQTAGAFTISPQLVFDGGCLCRLEPGLSMNRKPIILCDIPTQVLENQPYLARVHIINPASFDLVLLETDFNLTLALPQNADINIAGQVPPVFVSGHIWTQEFWLPEFTQENPVSYTVTLNKPGPSSWHKQDQGVIQVVPEFNRKEDIELPGETLIACCRKSVIQAGQYAEIQLYIENETPFLWETTTELKRNTGTPQFQWEIVALYPGIESPEHIPVVLRSLVSLQDNSPAGVYPSASVMPGMTAFCNVQVQPPPWPGVYNLTAPGMSPIRMTFLGPERSVRPWTECIVSNNYENRHYLTDNTRSSTWNSQTTIHPNTSVHVIFNYPCRVQGVRLIAPQTDGVTLTAANLRQTQPRYPSVLVSDDAKTWRRIIPENRWNQERNALDLWFPPCETHHLAIHANETRNQPWMIAEIKLL